MRIAGAPAVAPRLARLGAWHGLLVLNYHRITRHGEAPVGNPLWSATVEELDAQVAFLARHAEVIDPCDLLAPAQRRPKRAVMLTFDDGYRDNHDLALPVLRRHGIPAAFFIATGFIDDPHVAWWDEIEWMLDHAQRDELPAGRWLARPLALDPDHRDQALYALTTVYKALGPERTEAFLDELGEAAASGRAPTAVAREQWMTWDMVRALRDAGMRIGGHTVHHPVLSMLDPDCQRAEIEDCGMRLEQELGERMRLFAYPVGLRESFDARTRAALQAAGVEIAFSYYGGYQRWSQLDAYDVRRASVAVGMEPERFRAMTAAPQAFARW
jgi:peptidoglycan/xylan/chitin deacetylase (PgdA/CDA1 family)